MNVKVTGRTGEVTPAMKARARERADKLRRFYDRITWMDIVLDFEHARSRVEASAGLTRGATLVGKATDPDMYAAIEQALLRLERQLKKVKEKRSDHRLRKGRQAEAPHLSIEPAPSAGEAEG